MKTLGRSVAPSGMIRRIGRGMNAGRSVASTDGSYRKEEQSVSAFSYFVPSNKNATRKPSATKTSQDPVSSQLSSLPRPFHFSFSDVFSRSE